MALLERVPAGFHSVWHAVPPERGGIIRDPEGGDDNERADEQLAETELARMSAGITLLEIRLVVRTILARRRGPKPISYQRIHG
jgi:hypothetical protein